MKSLLYTIVAFLLLINNVYAQDQLLPGIELSPYISSNMVLQHGKAFPFRGYGPAKKTITLDFEREGVHYYDTAMTDAEGKFVLNLEPLEITTNGCSATFQILANDDTSVTFSNILIGDVWFAGGQSNMEKKVDYLLEAEQVIADAENHLNIRGFRVIYNHQFEPVDEIKAGNEGWFVCDSKSVSKASAVAYIFAKEVYKETGIPIGLMQAYVGGTELETWLSEKKINEDADLKMVKDRIPGINMEDPKFHQKYPSVNFNGMIRPLIHFPIKGILFYQGESNVKRATEYKTVLKALVEDWRSQWRLGDIPFYYVQLFNIGITHHRNYEKTNDQNTWQMVREQQLLLAEDESVKNVGMAVIIETNESHLNTNANIRIHPQNKAPVGKRLARIALKEQYGKNITAYSPIISDYWIKGSQMYLKFKNVGEGLKIRTGESQLKGFALAGLDGVYHKANAKIEDDETVVISSPSVTSPLHAAYGWSRDPICTLDNSVDLPASPFRTVTKSLFDDKVYFYEKCNFEDRVVYIKFY